MADHLLIIEDDETIRVTLGGFLARQGYGVDLAASGAEALALLARRSYRMVLADLRLPDMSGLDILARIKGQDDEAPVVIMTAYPEVRTAIEALKAGAYDYVNKPFDLEDIRELVRRTLETQRLKREVAWRRAQGRDCGMEGLVGDSPAFRALQQVTKKIAAAGRVPVLIHGESGTGKERVARAIHCLSGRAGGPWVALNCSALPEGLMESELFGHEKGAFTDARAAKPGLLELADGGTLFLDEIGDLSLSLQPKLLRVLETQSFRRLGGQKEIQVDVRFVSATHRSLPAMVKTGSFREDLYYRLNVGAIDVPPLRERRDDVIPLAHHFAGEAAINIGVDAPDLEPAAEALLTAYVWPGNIRELRNVIERATILCGGRAIGPAHLPREMQGGAAPAGLPLAQSGGVPTLAEMELRHIRQVLELAGGNKTRAAELLGISRLTLRNKLKEHGLVANT